MKITESVAGKSPAIGMATIKAIANDRCCLFDSGYFTVGQRRSALEGQHCSCRCCLSTNSEKGDRHYVTLPCEPRQTSRHERCVFARRSSKTDPACDVHGTLIRLMIFVRMADFRLINATNVITMQAEHLL